MIVTVLKGAVISERAHFSFNGGGALIVATKPVAYAHIKITVDTFSTEQAIVRGCMKIAPTGIITC